LPPLPTFHVTSNAATYLCYCTVFFTLPTAQIEHNSFNSCPSKLPCNTFVQYWLQRSIRRKRPIRLMRLMLSLTSLISDLSDSTQNAPHGQRLQRVYCLRFIELSSRVSAIKGRYQATCRLQKSLSATGGRFNAFIGIICSPLLGCAGLTEKFDWLTSHYTNDHKMCISISSQK